MKRVFRVIVPIVFIVTLSGCFFNGNSDPVTQSGFDSSGTAGQSDTVSKPAQTTAQTTAPVTTALPVTTTKAPTKPYTTQSETSTIPGAKPVIATGKDTGTTGTYTGFEPLPPVEYTVNDPKNERGLSEKSVGYSWGDAKNNQIYFDKKGFNALAIDTKSPGKVLYLTFDCGWENGYTAKVLDTLKAKKVPAAFFCTYNGYIDRQQELVARMIKEGHIVGNHSTSHPMFPGISRSKMAREIQDCDNYLRTRFGYSAPYFRFPAGEYSDSALDLVGSLGFKSVFWSVAYRDWEVDNQKGRQFAFDTVTSLLHPGAVILLHTVSKDNAAALGDIIDYARDQGYVFKQLP